MRAFSVFLCAVSIVFAATSAAPLRAQDADSAKHFLETVYQQYAKHGQGIDFTGPTAKSVFDSSLVALLHADQKAVGSGEVGALDGDPICSCQDWDGIFDLKIAVRMLTDGRATAAVTFALFAPKAGTDQDFRSLQMTLAREGVAWRIDNIRDKSDPKAPFDLRAELEKEIRTSKHVASKTKTGGQGSAR